MKILLACHNINDVGGSELYHLELANHIVKFLPELVLATFTPKDKCLLKSKLDSKILHLNLNELDTYNFDLIVASQPHVLDFLINKFPDTPKIAIIHSVIRSEDPVFHSSIKHYIAVQPDIYKMLKKHVSTNQISLIYNPVDSTRFNSTINKTLDKPIILFVGNWNDPIRYNSANHLIENCIENDWECWFVSKEKNNKINHPNIKFFDQVYNTEIFLAYADATAGLGGRNTIEGWMCDKPSYIYKIDNSGNILNISLVHPPKTFRFDASYVATQHINLYKQIINQ